MHKLLYLPSHDTSGLEAERCNGLGTRLEREWESERGKISDPRRESLLLHKCFVQELKSSDYLGYAGPLLVHCENFAQKQDRSV